MDRDRVGVVVKSEDRSIIVSVVSMVEGQDAFEVRIDYDEQSTVPKLGTWLVLRRTGNDNYEVERKCRKPVLPTRIYKNNVMLVVSIYFQAKGEEGYGEWVWASKLGKVAAICHKNYETKQAYLALAVRTAAKYRPCIECNWMLTKYIERPGSEHVFEKIGHSNCDSFSDSDPLVKPFSSDSVSLAQTLTSKAKRDLITGSVVVPISANTALENIKIFRGVVTLLSGSFAVIQPEGHIGFLKNNRSDNSLRDLKIGDWVAVAGVQRGKTIAYDIINLPSLISAEAPTKVKRGTVLVLSEVKVEYANGNEFYGNSPILGTVVGVTDFLARKDDFIVAWCCPRVCAGFEIFWEATEFLTASNSVSSNGNFAFITFSKAV